MAAGSHPGHPQNLPPTGLMAGGYGTYGAVPPGLFVGLLLYQVTFRISEEWGGLFFPARRSLSTVGRNDLDSRVASSVHALLQLGGCLGLGMAERGAEQLWACPEELLFYVWVMCGYLTSDLMLTISCLPIWHSSSLPGGWPRLVQRSCALLFFGVIGGRQIGGVLAQHLLLLEGITLALNVRWLLLSHSSAPSHRWSALRVDGVHEGGLSAGEALGAAAPVLACVGVGSVLLPSLLDELQHLQAALLSPPAASEEGHRSLELWGLALTMGIQLALLLFRLATETVAVVGALVLAVTGGSERESKRKTK
eukprot:COSAG04_NODE_5011_length_1782_cov_7.085561_1_plen_309_part_00